ncbi:MAG: hypothetical protein Ct9H300mP5_0770 [Candidatus Pelagibacterales bacterium]|nr:MAG: hypothetical protein Ct9H300mP5_0770 [Pelagibacterales bacterium]
MQKNGFKVTEVVANAWNNSLVKLLENKNSKKLLLNNGKSYQISDVRKKYSSRRDSRINM